MKTLLILSFLLFFSAYPQSFSENVQRGSKIEGLFLLRDPFKPPVELLRDSKKDKKGRKLLRDGVYTNIVDVRFVDLSKLEVLGVLVGKERRAVAKIPGSGTFILKEGMKVGINGVELKAILPGGVIFTEKLSNVYGEDEYLETVIPVNE